MSGETGWQLVVGIVVGLALIVTWIYLYRRSGRRDDQGLAQSRSLERARASAPFLCGLGLVSNFVTFGFLPGLLGPVVRTALPLTFVGCLVIWAKGESQRGRFGGASSN